MVPKPLTSSTSIPTKTTLPTLFPSPTHPQHFTLPPQLRDRLTSLLISSPGRNSIPKIQAAFATALRDEGYMDELRSWVLDVARSEDGERLSVHEVMDRVVRGVRDVLGTANGEEEVDGDRDRKGEGNGVNGDGDENGGREGNETLTRGGSAKKPPRLPKSAIDKGAWAVKEELDTCCTVAVDQY